MNIPSALSVAQITLYLAAVAALVSALITQFVAPLVNRVPALATDAPDQTLRNLVLRAANLALSVVGVLGLAAIAGQLSQANIVPTVAAVITVSVGAHAAYKLIPSPASAAPASSAAVASSLAPAGLVLDAGPAPVLQVAPALLAGVPAPAADAAPLHQQAAPLAPADAT